jgi:hypothetical protein
LARATRNVTSGGLILSELLLFHTNSSRDNRRPPPIYPQKNPLHTSGEKNEKSEKTTNKEMFETL